MKKQFLLGLMAMLLPLAGWALADDGAEDQTPLNEFVVSLTDDFATTNEIEYKGSATVGVKVTITYVTPSGQVTSDLNSTDHYTVSYTKDGEEVTTIKDAGNYAATITGKGVYAGKTATANFTIKKVELKLPDGDAITKKGAAMQYGASENDELDIAQLVELTKENGLVEDESGEELKDALKCLSLEEAANTGSNVGDAALFWVRANEESNSKNYEYKGTGVLLDKISIVPKTLDLAFEENENHSVYNGTKVSLDDLAITGLNFVEKDKDYVTVTRSLEDDKEEIKNAGDYKITVSLDGTAAKNYVISYGEGKNELTYTVDRATIKIDVKEGKELERAYNGKALAWDELEDYFSITGIVDGEKDDVNLTMKPEEKSADVNEDPGYTIALYKGEDKIESEGFDTPEGLDNYKIEYEEASFKITPKIVTYYFAGTAKKYTGQTITLSDQDYTAEILDGVLEDDEDDVEIKNPTAKFEDEEVKNVGEYALVLNTAGSLTGDKADNYKFAEAPSEVSEEATDDQKKLWNKFEVTPGTMKIMVQTQQIAFGTEIDDQMKNKWAQFSSETGITKGSRGATGTEIVNDPYETAGTDRTAMRNLITFELSADAQTGKSGTYTEGIIVKLLDKDPTNKLSEEAVVTLYKNYGGREKITTNHVTLIINNVELEGGLVLNGSEGLVLDENADEAEEPEAEEEMTVAEKIAYYNGAEVNEVKIVNLVNYVGYRDENGTYKYTDANNTFVAGHWYTLVLPFEVTLSELSEQLGYAVFYTPNAEKTYVGDNSWSIITFSMTFEKIPANTMILFRVDGSKEIAEGLTFNNKTIVNLTDEQKENGIEINDGINYVPVYAKKTLTSTNYTEWFLRTDDSKFLGVTALMESTDPKYDGLEIYPFNGYVTTPIPNGYEGKARFFIEEADGTITAISAITGETINSNAAEGWYTIGGVKLNAQPTQKGVYINNGQKVVIK